MSEFTIVGAGMAGLLAAAMLRDECIKVVEKQYELPNNHNALLRFRSSIVGDTVNIPFTPVDVIKTVDVAQPNLVAAAIAYSRKTTGSINLRSVLSAGSQLERRWIAPENFIKRLRTKITCPLELGTTIDLKRAGRAVISTIPMPSLMQALDYEKVVKRPIVPSDLYHTIPEFKSIEGCTLTATLHNCDICASIYVTDMKEKAYRVSITRDKFIAEYAFWTDVANPENELRKLLSLFAIDESYIVSKAVLKPQRYAKILPINEDERKRFILWATENFNIYSLGRFATWRPGLLLDDIVNDVRVIQKLANGGTSYNSRLNTSYNSRLNTSYNSRLNTKE